MTEEQELTFGDVTPVDEEEEKKNREALQFGDITPVTSESAEVYISILLENVFMLRSFETVNLA